MWGCGAVRLEMQLQQRVTKQLFRRTFLESQATESESLVVEKQLTLRQYPSTAGHVVPGGKQGGPPSKAKHYLATDSEQYREGKVKSTPGGE